MRLMRQWDRSRTRRSNEVTDWSWRRASARARTSGRWAGTLGLTAVLALTAWGQPAAQDQSGAAPARFVLMLGGEAVMDTKTGLVWEQTPDTFHGTWTEAAAHCLAKAVGGRRGWRIPTVQELSSLVDAEQKDPALPSGHPFSDVRSAIYWSGTPSATDDIVAWHVSFFSGEVVTDQKSQTRRAWCVLGEPEKPRGR